jgi:hypothetical protein
MTGKKIILRIAIHALAISLLTLGYHHLYGKKHHALLIIGCARSGTTYITNVLNRCGYKVGHEWPKRDGACSWEMAVNTDKVPFGRGKKGHHFERVFHQVRHPLKVISSHYYTAPPESFAFIREHLPEISGEDSLLTQTAKYWYYWNLLCEKQSEWTYRVEELSSRWGEFEERMGKKLDKTALDVIPKTTNTRGSFTYLTWADLEKELDPDLYQKIRDLSQRYGYSN